MVSVLLSVSVERFYVSRMRDFYTVKRKRKKKLNSNYLELYLKTAFGNSFGRREVPQTVNA